MMQRVDGDTKLRFTSDSSNSYGGFKVCYYSGDEAVAPESFHQKHPKPTVSLTCTAGCSSIHMKGAENGEGYLIKAKDSTGAIFAVEGPAVIDFLAYQGTVKIGLSSGIFDVEGAGTQYLGTGHHNVTLIGTYEALLLPTTGGCRGFEHGGHATCTHSSDSTAVVRLATTKHFSKRDECKSLCKQYVAEHREDLENMCCFFGFSEDVLGCHGIKNGIYHEHGHHHSELGPVGSCEKQSVYLSPSAAALTDLSDILMARRPEAKLLKVTDTDQAGSSFAVLTGILLFITGASMTLLICKSWRTASPDNTETAYLKM